MAGCDGPTGEAWSAPHNACVGANSQTSCDSVAQTTCYYAYLLDSLGKVGWSSGKFLAGSGLKVHEPGALAEIGLNPGDFVNKINGVLLTDEATLLAELAAFTIDAPATVFSVTHLLGKFQLSLSH